MEKDLVNVILSEKYEPIPDEYSVELFLSVTREEFSHLMSICRRNKICLQVVHDFSEEEQ